MTEFHTKARIIEGIRKTHKTIDDLLYELELKRRRTLESAPIDYAVRERIRQVGRLFSELQVKERWLQQTMSAIVQRMEKEMRHAQKHADGSCMDAHRRCYSFRNTFQRDIEEIQKVRKRFQEKFEYIIK